MRNKKRSAATPARALAWHMASDISWVAIYRAAMLGLLSIVITMVGWQSSRIISRQDETVKEIAALRTAVSVEQTNVMNLNADVAGLAADIIKVDSRLSRTNDRQTEMGNAISVLQSQIGDLRATVMMRR